MNKYFDDLFFENNDNNEFIFLKELENIEIELLLTNPLVDQNLKGDKDPIYRPPKQIFKQNQEMIFAGCSQTHGDHICPPLVPNGSYEQIWGFLVAKKMNFDAINLGIGAEGSYRIIQRLFSHFSSYGNPKILLCLFPDMFRFISPRDKNNLIGKRPFGTYTFLEGTFHGTRDVQEISSFNKKPYKKEEVISKMIPLFYNIQAILMLEQYCKATGIKLLWGSWSNETNLLIETIKKHIKNNFINFVNLDKEKINFKNKECHMDLYLSNPLIYSKGIDGQHMGTHQHAHVADMFVENIKNDNTWN